MGSTAYEDDEIYEDDEEGLSYEPPKPVTAEDVAGLDKLRSLAHVDHLLDGIDENIKLINHREYTRLRGERLLNLEKAHRAPRCQHVRLSGKACGSPAVSGQQYCHFHGLAKADLCFELPVIEDSRSFQIAVMRLCQQIARGAIEPVNAKIMLQALELALDNIRKSTALGPQKDEYPQPAS